jgi:hypothetical protein
MREIDQSKYGLNRMVMTLNMRWSTGQFPDTMRTEAHTRSNPAFIGLLFEYFCKKSQARISVPAPVSADYCEWRFPNYLVDLKATHWPASNAYHIAKDVKETSPLSGKKIRNVGGVSRTVPSNSSPFHVKMAKNPGIANWKLRREVKS